MPEGNIPQVRTCGIMDIPRLETVLPSEHISRAIHYAFTELGYSAATKDQERAIREFLQGRDVFVSLPTGEGKSLCFAALPYVFDCLKCHLASSCQQSVTKRSSIAVVVSPLTSLMKDQVAKFSERGLKCAFVAEEQTDPAVKSAVAAGHYQLVYLSPESLLCVLQWREMFRSAVYQRNLIAVVVDEAHCVEKW